jgi:AraC-like DNA-binding protein
MTYYIKYDLEAICRRLVQDQLTHSGLQFNLLNANELNVNHIVSEDLLSKLNAGLGELGIEIVACRKTVLVQKIKEAVIELISLEDKMVLSKTSYHLAKTLNQSYRYLSEVFSAVTYTTIENYIILQKIEKAKEMIATGDLTFTEIAWKLNYSSIAHFSMQFKNTTGFTPSVFKKIITEKKKNLILDGIKLYN